MKITGIYANLISKQQNHSLKNEKNNQNQSIKINPNYASLPLGNVYGKNVSFTADYESKQTVPDIEFETYKNMSPFVKKMIRKKYMTFHSDVASKEAELYDQNFKYLPLRQEQDMDDFIKISSEYLTIKDKQILCLGRSPKWFLNAALWMKDGIEKYKFVAFSKFWYMPDPVEGYRRSKYSAPTEVEEAAYRNYLRRIQATPLHIVKKFEEEGQKTAITDYICSGKGACSFLDLMSRFAEDEGVLEKFSKSIEIFGIGSREYMEQLAGDYGTVSDPKVFMPEKLFQYKDNIKQTFRNMPFRVFEEMLLNQNTNECRSTFYPHEAWTKYKPDLFKTGLIKDWRKIEALKNDPELPFGKKLITSFTSAMRDYRNLLNFRILDALNERDLLKAVHHTRI